MMPNELSVQEEAEAAYPYVKYGDPEPGESFWVEGYIAGLQSRDAEIARLKGENEKVRALNERWNCAIQWVITGGSEFIDDPERCAKNIRERYQLGIDRTDALLKKIPEQQAVAFAEWLKFNYYNVDDCWYEEGTYGRFAYTTAELYKKFTDQTKENAKD